MKPDPEGGVAALFVNLGTGTATGSFPLSSSAFLSPGQRL